MSEHFLKDAEYTLGESEVPLVSERTGRHFACVEPAMAANGRAEI